MSERLNMYGFSIRQMRRLSRDPDAVRRIQDRLAATQTFWPEWVQSEVAAILERAIMVGVPFAGLEIESNEHCLAAGALALDEQEWHDIPACDYHRTAMEALWKQFGRYARPETRAFLRGLVEGIPLFGQQPSPDAPYATISLAKLHAFQPGLEDFRTQVTYRVEQKRDPSDDDCVASVFVADFCGWIDEIRQAGRDLWVWYR